MKCDILIVGAGPAGSSAARVAAKAGADVVLVDRRERVGVPVQCAEYIPAWTPGDLDLGRSYVVQSIRGMRTYLPDGDIKETMSPGFTIDRARFDQVLARDAETAGARLLLSTAALGLEGDSVLIRRESGDRCRVKATVIIGADGPRSLVAQWMGTGSKELIPGVQASISLTQPKAYAEVYFDPRLFGGYGWLFPKAKVANVGLAAKRRKDQSASLSVLLMEFLDRLAREGKVSGRPHSYTAGWIPTAPVKHIVCGNMMLVGDAAGHTHPITGAGVFAAITGGAMAGKAAATAISADNMALLQLYETKFQDLFGSTLQRGTRRRQVLETQWADLDRIIRSCWIAFREYYEA